jgi:hypothetical protein
MLHDREPQSGTAFIPGAGRVRAVKPLENPLEVLAYDSRPIVAYADGNPAIVPPAAAHNAAAGWGITHGVVEQVGEHLADGIGIGENRPGIARDIDLELDAPRVISVS